MIPTLNEARAIADIVKNIRQQNLDVLVIDDGSTDNTHRAAADNGAVVIKSLRNEGKGASLIKGFDYALKNNYDAVITMDGDGQHLAEEIPYFVRVADTSNSDILVGNRMTKKRNMPLIRVFTNKFMSWFISWLCKQKIPDSQCGFRLIKRWVLEKISLSTRKYEIESELLIKAARVGAKIESVGIRSVYSGERSAINPFVDTFRFFRYILSEFGKQPKKTKAE